MERQRVRERGGERQRVREREGEEREEDERRVCLDLMRWNHRNGYTRLESFQVMCFQPRLGETSPPFPKVWGPE